MKLAKSSLISLDTTHGGVSVHLAFTLGFETLGVIHHPALATTSPEVSSLEITVDRQTSVAPIPDDRNGPSYEYFWSLTRGLDLDLAQCRPQCDLSDFCHRLTATNSITCAPGCASLQGDAAGYEMRRQDSILEYGVLRTDINTFGLALCVEGSSVDRSADLHMPR